ncbi:adenylyl-sulfate kinase [Brachybacterium squillarum]|uniref:adenylyl-sulfate kinase n=1 Tax=Brachybacterium squillarum TaxID=661979 RepID=UPI00222227A0|nr:adenylyl-sulfate kinase [Brachybacterium squillarum]MCW1806613.1 adenylyl-sulfate kinase [Brachybacterium squillarum]
MSAGPGHGTGRALLITGAVGVGKTTTADAVGDELEERGIPGAVLDVDTLRRAWPAPPGDRFHAALTLRALTALSAIHREAGARVLVAAEVIEERSARDAYEQAMGLPLTVVRIRTPRELVRERLRERHARDPEGLAWHRDRFDELTAILDAAAVEDVSVGQVGSPRETARALLAAVGLGDRAAR